MTLALIDTWPVGVAAAAEIRNGEPAAHRGPCDHVFALASITKVLTATAVLVAVEEESVSLDDTVAGAPAAATLRDLLDHSSGLAPDEPKALGDVGARRVYSNVGYELAANHVATSTGIAFPTYLHEAVFEQAGMRATSLDGSPAHGASSTVHDLVRFLTALRSETLLSATGVTLLTQPSRPTISGVLPGYGRQEQNLWGLGAEVRGQKAPHWTAPENSPATWGHFGRAGTFVWTDPSHDVSLVCLTDTPFGEWALDRWPALSSAVLQGWQPGG